MKLRSDQKDGKDCSSPGSDGSQNRPRGPPQSQDARRAGRGIVNPPSGGQMTWGGPARFTGPPGMPQQHTYQGNTRVQQQQQQQQPHPGPPQPQQNPSHQQHETFQNKEKMDQSGRGSIKKLMDAPRPNSNETPRVGAGTPGAQISGPMGQPPMQQVPVMQMGPQGYPVVGGFRGNGPPPVVSSPGLPQGPGLMHPGNAALQVNQLQQQFQQLGLVQRPDEQQAVVNQQVYGVHLMQQQRLLQAQHQSQQQHSQQQPQLQQPKMSAMAPPPGFGPPGLPSYYQAYAAQHAQAQAQQAPPFPMPHPSLVQQQQLQAIINATLSAAAAGVPGPEATLRATLKPGLAVYAKYWEDNKFYRAHIVQMTERGCQVHFTDYGNVEDVALSDIALANADPFAAMLAAAAATAQSPPPASAPSYFY
ncbi:unnamed protein product [Notodromas monacha]|uniref:Tudor domain-containing protein n=1 Tax=Notodromas monacha TaxID=399045 RepID=A0A7R9GBL8_9CRUS|nr:unnamed protein product [Notodromas monacha]CAG0915127.1 unnamed protein product [Notodromas monacha]